MRPAAALFALLVVASPTVARGQTLQSQLYTKVEWAATSTTQVAAKAAAWVRPPSGVGWDYDWDIVLDCTISGPTSAYAIDRDNGYVPSYCRVTGYPLPAGCYRGAAEARATKGTATQTQGAGTSQYCISAPPPASPPPTQERCDGLTTETYTCSPILINLSDGPWRLAGADDAVWFDIDANGVANRITWTGRGEPLAFLALDRNGNGAIDDGGELFGTATRLASGERASNGFKALEEFDANGDGVVDPADSVWGALLLWNDGNHDGLSQPHEVTKLADSEVTALRTAYHATSRRDRADNEFRFMSLLERNGQHRPYYDVFFVTVD